MHSNSFVSVLIPVYNAGPFLAEAVESVLCQSHRNMEILCWDDGSSDNSRQLLDELAAHDARIRLFSHDENRGIIETRNALLEQARGDYIAWLDADDIILPTKLEQQLHFLSRHSSCGAVGTGVGFVDLGGTLYKEEFYSDDPVRQRNDPQICCASVMVRRAAVEQAGGFRAIYHYGGEDGDWLLRIADFWEVRNLHKALYRYRQNPDSISHKNISEIRRLGVIARYAARIRRQTQSCPVDNGLITTLADDYFIDSPAFTPEEKVTATTFPLGSFPPLVTVAMPCFNRFPLVLKALAALDKQIYRNFELVIYDDGSENPLAETEAFKTLAATLGYRLRVERGSENKGPAYARNRILDAAQGRFVMFHDSDDISEPDRIKVLLQALLGTSDCVGMGSGVHFIDTSDGILGTESYPPLAAGKFGFFGCCATFMYRFRENKDLRFDGNNRKYPEDIEFLLRLSGRGYLYNLPNVLYRYRKHHNAITSDPQWRDYCMRFMLTRVARDMNVISNGELNLDMAPLFLRSIDGTVTGNMVVAWLWRKWRVCGGSLISLLALVVLFRTSFIRMLWWRVICRLPNVIKTRLIRLGYWSRRITRNAPKKIYRKLQKAAPAGVWRIIVGVRYWLLSPRANNPDEITVRVLDSWGDAQEALSMLLPAGTCKWRGVRFITHSSWLTKPDYYLILNQPAVDTTIRAHPSRVLFALGEPPTRAHQVLHDGQGAGTTVFTPDETASKREANMERRFIPVPCMTRTWSVKKNFDELLSSGDEIVKTRKLSWVTSNLNILPGHRRRLAFLEKLRAEIDFDLFGRGFQSIQDKWNALEPYKYSVAFENTLAPLYFTEKPMDCFVALTVPLYCGSPALGRYFPEKAFIRIDPDDPKVIHHIRDILEFDDYAARRGALEEAKNLVLTKYNMFIYLANWIKAQPAYDGPKETFHLKSSSIDWSLEE
jgi:glycosyltransferase involved in cell wall biosynthesis